MFDHTVRNSGATSLNNLGQKNVQAAAVARVHCDYTDYSAPRRFKQLCEKPSYTGILLDKEEVASVIDGNRRFAFVNIWRSIDRTNPVYSTAHNKRGDSKL